MTNDIATYRSLFPYLDTGCIYMNHAAISPLSKRVVDAIHGYLKQRSETEIENFLTFQRTLVETKEMIGKLINASSERIALVDNTSNGFNLLANGLKWKTGDRILLNDMEFPSNVYPFLNLKRHGVEIDFVKNRNGMILLEDIEQALTPRTRLLSISHVQFLNGFRIDLEGVGDLCKTRGIIFSVDPIQSAGALQIDVKKASIDFISCGGHKWLMSPQGSAFIFLTEELQERIQQAYVGWTSVANPWNLLDYNLDLQPSARRYENGTMNFMGICGMHAALSLLLEIGIETIESRILELTDFLVAQLSDAHVDPATCIQHEHRSGIVSFKSDKSQAVYDKLLSEKIELAVREGLVRFSPHFYNTEEEIEKAVEIIKGMQ